MDDLRFYGLFNSISVISGRRADDNERLYAKDKNKKLKSGLLQFLFGTSRVKIKKNTGLLGCQNISNIHNRKLS